MRAHCTARMTRTLPTPTCVVENQHVLAGLDDRRPGVAPVVRLAEDVDLPELGISPHLQGDVLRDDDTEVADVHASLDVRLRAREADVAQVEGHFADSELVGVAEVLRAGDDVAAVADAIAEIDVERGRDDGSAHEQKREQRAEYDRQDA